MALWRLYEGGTVQEECLTRLPLSGSLESSYASLLAPFDGDEATRAQIQLILNRATQVLYSCSEVPDIELPARIPAIWNRSVVGGANDRRAGASRRDHNKR